MSCKSTTCAPFRTNVSTLFSDNIPQDEVQKFGCLRRKRLSNLKETKENRLKVLSRMSDERRRQEDALLPTVGRGDYNLDMIIF